MPLFSVECVRGTCIVFCGACSTTFAQEEGALPANGGHDLPRQHRSALGGSDRVVTRTRADFLQVCEASPSSPPPPIPLSLLKPVCTQYLQNVEFNREVILMHGRLCHCRLYCLCSMHCCNAPTVWHGKDKEANDQKGAETRKRIVPSQVLSLACTLPTGLVRQVIRGCRQQVPCTAGHALHPPKKQLHGCITRVAATIKNITAGRFLVPPHRTPFQRKNVCAQCFGAVLCRLTH